MDDDVQTVDFVGMIEKHIDSRAVQVPDRAEVDGDWPASSRARRVECLDQLGDVAEIDLACRSHPGRPVWAVIGVQTELCGH
ncbi:hypothetical protein ATCCBAA256_03120 [Mycobacterium montefiorense]|nr:hypothetical protein ATCCBAA256_03120 [Mycobacterium montefiorense]